MKNPSGELQIRNLAIQLFPTQSKFFLEAYHDATNKKFSYLLIDLHPNTSPELRLKTNIYPDDTLIIYVPRG